MSQGSTPPVPYDEASGEASLFLFAAAHHELLILLSKYDASKLLRSLLLSKASAPDILCLQHNAEKGECCLSLLAREGSQPAKPQGCFPCSRWRAAPARSRCLAPAGASHSGVFGAAFLSCGRKHPPGRLVGISMNSRQAPVCWQDPSDHSHVKRIGLLFRISGWGLRNRLRVFGIATLAAVKSHLCFDTEFRSSARFLCNN